MMKVKALINMKTVDGKKVGPYLAGQVFDLDDNTANKWASSAMVEKVVDPVPEPEVEVKEEPKKSKKKFSLEEA